MDTYISYGLQFSLGFFLQYAILDRNWLLAIVAIILLFLASMVKVDTYKDTISFFVGVIAATYYKNI